MASVTEGADHFISQRHAESSRGLRAILEDDHEICGDIDVENFPTLAVFRGDVPVHFGVSTPQEATLARLIDELASRTVSARDVPEEVRALPGALRGARSNAPR